MMSIRTSSRKVLREQPEACFLCVLMFVCAMSLIVVGFLFQDTLISATAALIVGLVMLIAFSILLRPVIAKVNAFTVLQAASHVSVSGAAFYFFTDDTEQFPDGPHFSQNF